MAEIDARRGVGARSRNRLDVVFASPSARLGAGVRRCEAGQQPRRLLARSASSRSRLVQERAAHRIAATLPLLTVTWNRCVRDVARAEHLRARPEVRAPDPPVAFVEAHGIERVDRFPVRVEARRPTHRASARNGGAGSRRRGPRGPFASIASIASAGSGSSRRGRCTCGCRTRCRTSRRGR